MWQKRGSLFYPPLFTMKFLHYLQTFWNLEMSLTMRLNSVYQISHCMKVKAFNNPQNKRISIYHVPLSLFNITHNCSNSPANTDCSIVIDHYRTQDLGKTYTLGTGFSSHWIRWAKRKKKDDLCPLKNINLWIPKSAVEYQSTHWIYFYSIFRYR